MSFVLSVIRPPEGEAKYGKATTLDPVSTPEAVQRRVEYVLKSEGVDANDAASFSLAVGVATPGWKVPPHDGTGLTFRVDEPVDGDAPHPCPCCGRLVLPTDHAYAGSEDAYCTGCFTWDRNTEACLPENSAHAFQCVHCGAEIEHMDEVGWVEVEIGGHYDICPENAGGQHAIGWE